MSGIRMQNTLCSQEASTENQKEYPPIMADPAPLSRRALVQYLKSVLLFW